MLKYNMLSKQYKDHVVVNNLNIEINDKDIVGFLGPNGAGKTTTIKMSCGLIIPTKGDVECCGYSLKKDRKQYLKNIGAVLEGNRNIYWKLSPVENIEYFAGMKGIGKKKIRNQMDEYLEMFNLTEKRNMECGKLSRGMQQKVAICCSLIHNPKVLFLDEPTLGLDVQSVLLIRDVLKNLIKEDRTMIITSHDLNFISSLCNRIIIINNGTMVLDEDIGFLNRYSENIVYVVEADGICEDIEKIIKEKFDVEVDKCKDSIRFKVLLNNDNEIIDFLNFLKSNGMNIKDMYKKKSDLEDIFTEVISDEKDRQLNFMGE